MERFAFGAIGVWFFVIVAALSGYVINIVTLIQNWHWPPDIEVALQLAGVVVPPLGAVMGWISILT